MGTSWSNYMMNIKKNIRKYIRNIDIICEILDSRIPMSSYNYDLNTMFEYKKKIIILNKVDLSDMQITKKWTNYFNDQNKTLATIVNSKNNKLGINNFFQVLDDYHNNIHKFKNNKIKMIIIGTPNVGKSTFINSIVGKRMAKCGNKPGITKGFQWFNHHSKFDLLDCPGIFYSNMSEKSNFNLRLVGSIEETSVQLENLVYSLMDVLINKHINKIIQIYNIVLPTECNNRYTYITTILCNIAKKRGLIIKNSNIDNDRLYKLLLNDFKNGKFGNISLEEPQLG